MILHANAFFGSSLCIPQAPNFWKKTLRAAHRFLDNTHGHRQLICPSPNQTMVELQFEPRKSSSQNICNIQDPCVPDSFLVYSRMLLFRPGIRTDLTQVSLASFPSKDIIYIKRFRGYYPFYSTQTCVKKTNNKDVPNPSFRSSQTVPIPTPTS